VANRALGLMLILGVARVSEQRFNVPLDTLLGHFGDDFYRPDDPDGSISRTKRQLSPGGTPQDAQSQVKRTKQK